MTYNKGCHRLLDSPKHPWRVRQGKKTPLCSITAQRILLHLSEMLFTGCARSRNSKRQERRFCRPCKPDITPLAGSIRRRIAADLAARFHRGGIGVNRFLPLVFFVVEMIQPLDDDAFFYLAVAAQHIADVQPAPYATVGPILAQPSLAKTDG